MIRLRARINPFASATKAKKKKVAGPSPLEKRFDALWKALHGPPLEKEVRFCPTRKWRADFLHAESRTLIELEGGVFCGGRHTRGRGFVADCEKYLEAWHLGYTVLRLTAPQLRKDILARVVAKIKAVGPLGAN